MVQWIVGIDEAGRGPLAGPVTVAAVAAKRGSGLRVQGSGRLKDSKRLSSRQREILSCTIKSNEGFRWAVASVGPKIIDKQGITRALNRAVAAVLHKLFPNSYSSRRPNRNYQKRSRDPDLASGLNSIILLDGSLYAPSQLRQCTVIKGDEQISLIAAASIIAKVHRDKLMERHHQHFPQYGFDIHKGYGTRLHYRRLQELGPCSIHRRSFLKSLQN